MNGFHLTFGLAKMAIYGTRQRSESAVMPLTDNTIGDKVLPPILDTIKCAKTLLISKSQDGNR